MEEEEGMEEGEQCGYGEGGHGPRLVDSERDDGELAKGEGKVNMREGEVF